MKLTWLCSSLLHGSLEWESDLLKVMKKTMKEECWMYISHPSLSDRPERPSPSHWTRQRNTMCPCGEERANTDPISQRQGLEHRELKRLHPKSHGTNNKGMVSGHHTKINAQESTVFPYS